MEPKFIIAMALLVIPMFIFIGMYRGWKKRQSRFLGLDTASLLKDCEKDVQPVRKFSGEYIVTTVAGDWLDRINVEHLGVKSRSTLSVCDDSVHVTRKGAAALTIPRKSIEEITSANGAAGKFFWGQKMVCIRYEVGDQMLDTYWKPADSVGECFESLEKIMDTRQSVIS